MMRLSDLTTTLTLIGMASAIAGLGLSATRADELDAAMIDAVLNVDSAHGLLSADTGSKFLGARSCAAAACHGGVQPDPRFELSRRNEFVVWLDKDPHSRGFRTLLSDSSRQILRRLRVLGPDDQIRDQARMANCLACHNPQPAVERQAQAFFKHDGISCEICHGPAEKWIDKHVDPDWQQWKEEGAAIGFLDMEDLTLRARTCAQCHVGSPGREVNHDLIAAGHPALKFELTAYHDILPKHWRDQEERRRNSDLELELWSRGQAASAEAALELLAWRAQRATDEEADAVWPEFAEYDCFACHHDLTHPSWRQRRPAVDRPLGMATWGSWYFSLLRQAGATGLDPLIAEMQKSLVANPAAVQEAIANVRIGSARLNTLVRGSNSLIPPTVTNWDEATQVYLLLVALEQARRDRTRETDTEIDDAISALRERLAFPEGFDSPKGTFAAETDEMSPTELTRALRRLARRLHGTGNAE